MGTSNNYFQHSQKYVTGNGIFVIASGYGGIKQEEIKVNKKLLLV